MGGPFLDRTPARNRARDITIKVKRLDGDAAGKLRLTPLEAPWFAVVVGSPVELARGLQRCLAEVEVRAYALLKRQTPDGAKLGVVADQDEPEQPAPTFSQMVPRKTWRQQAWRTGGTEREHHPSVWKPNADGSFTNQVSGRTARHPDLVGKIVRRRVAAGLPVVPVDGVFDLSTLAEQIERSATGAGMTPHEWLAAAVAGHSRPRRSRRARGRAVADGQLALELDTPNARNTQPRQLRSGRRRGRGAVA